MHLLAAILALALVLLARAEAQATATATPTATRPSLTAPRNTTTTLLLYTTVYPSPPTTTTTSTVTRPTATNAVGQMAVWTEADKAERLNDRAKNLRAAASVPGVVLAVAVVPLFVAWARRYDRETRRILADARAADVNAPWDIELAAKGYGMHGAPPLARLPAAAVAAAVPLLATRAAAAPTTTTTYYYFTRTGRVSTAVETVWMAAESYYAQKYAVGNAKAERTIMNCTIAAPIVAGVPVLLMASVTIVLIALRRRAVRFANPKVEYWGVN